MPINVVILAAGLGKRMHSQRPKVLHVLAGRPLVSHVIDAARAIDARRIVVVYGHGGEKVREAVSGPDLAYARQEPQLGTGHAVQQALPMLTDAPVTLVLYGDVPLIRAQTLRRLVAACRDCVVVLTAELEDPSGYGRIVRSGSGAIRAIVEEKDAGENERGIREINTGLMALPTARLERWLGRLTNDNAQREYYLTDVVKLALADGVAAEAVRVDEPWETLGVNSRAQLAQLEQIYEREYAEQLHERGVALECGGDANAITGWKRPQKKASS